MKKIWAMNCALAGAKVARLLHEGKERQAIEYLRQLQILLTFIRELKMPERLEVSEAECMYGILSLMEKGKVELVKDGDVYSLRPTEPPVEEAAHLPILRVVAEAETIAGKEWDVKGRRP